MTLAEILLKLAELPAEATIVAEKPWKPTSRASVRDIPTAVLSELEIEGQSYFLEVFIARDLCDDLRSAGVTDDAALVQSVIKYAIDDA